MSFGARLRTTYTIWAYGWLAVWAVGSVVLVFTLVAILGVLCLHAVKDPTPALVRAAGLREDPVVRQVIDNAIGVNERFDSLRIVASEPMSWRRFSTSHRAFEARSPAHSQLFFAAAVLHPARGKLSRRQRIWLLQSPDVQVASWSAIALERATQLSPLTLEKLSGVGFDLYRLEEQRDTLVSVWAYNLLVLHKRRSRVGYVAWMSDLARRQYGPPQERLASKRERTA